MNNLSVDTKKLIARRIEPEKVGNALPARATIFHLTLEQKRIFLITLGATLYRIAIYLFFAGDMVVSNDQMQNIRLAQKFAAGNFYGVLDTYWTPLYPILIGIVSKFTSTPVISSVVVSIAASSLAVPLIYYFVREFYGVSEALIAIMIAVIYPHLINSFFEIGTENIYLIFILGALLAGWENLKRPALKHAMLTGIFLGLAYLTRPEAFGYLLLFIAFIFFGAKIRGKINLGFTTLQVAALLFTFFIFAAPYLIYLNRATGHWTLSGKMQTNLAAGMIQDNIDENAESNVAQFGGKASKPKILLVSFGRSLIEIQKILAYLVPSGLMIFVGLGIFRQRWKARYLSSLVYLCSFCAATITGYALTVSQTRYFYILLPIFFCWIAAGIVELKAWTAEHAGVFGTGLLHRFLKLRYIAPLALVSIFSYMLPINFFMIPTDKAWRERAYEERDAGLWIKNNGTKEMRIFSASYRPVFYAEGLQIQPRDADLPDLINQLRNSAADYVIVSDRSLKRHEYLEEFNKYVRNSGDYELVYSQHYGSDYHIDVFRPKIF